MSKKRQDKTGTGNSRGRQKTLADNDMVSAMDAVKSGRFTNTAAATQFSVPRKTLEAGADLGGARLVSFEPPFC